jgi:hypothetical protein
LTASEVRPVFNPARSTLERPDYDGHFVVILLTHDQFAIADEADVDLIGNGRWHALKSNRTWYAVRTVAGETVSMHVLIAGCKGVDHVNGNGLDNRRINLRPATPSQNGANRPPQRNNTSGYKGVYWNRPGQNWFARIKVAGRPVHLGMFADPTEAARAYNRAAMEAFGEYAWLNPV